MGSRSLRGWELGINILFGTPWGIFQGRHGSLGIGKLPYRAYGGMHGGCRHVGVIFGGSGQWSYGAIAMQIWGEGSFSILTLQPIVVYLLDDMPGAYVGYNNSITYDFNAADSDNALTVPLGATAYLGGICVAYFACGVLVTFGLGATLREKGLLRER